MRFSCFWARYDCYECEIVEIMINPVSWIRFVVHVMRKCLACHKNVQIEHLLLVTAVLLIILVMFMHSHHLVEFRGLV